MLLTNEPEPVAEAALLAVCLVPEGGGFRVARVPLSQAEVSALASDMSEPEVLNVQLAKASEALEDHARGNATDDKPGRATCPGCGRNTLVDHPSKPVRVCGACNARVEA